MDDNVRTSDMAIFKKKRWPTLSLEKVRAHARLLVIDDQDFTYTELFERDGYSIEKWNDVKDLSRLESGVYDIILLDIQGVAKRDAKEEGLGLLDHLRQVSPTQIIVAFSASEYSLKYQRFFDQADAKLAKDDDYVRFKRVIDELLERRYSLDFFVEKIVLVASGPRIDADRLRKEATKAVLQGADSGLMRLVEKGHDNKEVLGLVAKILGLAAAALKLLESMS